MKKINLAESDNLDKATLRTNHKIKNEEELDELSNAYKDLTNAYKKTRWTPIQIQRYRL